jgi:hypothetical protein
MSSRVIAIAALGDQIAPRELFVDVPNAPAKLPYHVKRHDCRQFAVPFAAMPPA